MSKLNLADVTAELLDARWATQQLEIAAATAQSAAAEIKELKHQGKAAAVRHISRAATSSSNRAWSWSSHWCSGHSNTCLMMTKAVATVTVVHLMMTVARQITTMVIVTDMNQPPLQLSLTVANEVAHA